MNEGAKRSPLHVAGRFDDPHAGAERSMPDHQRLFDAMARIRRATGIEPALVCVSRMLPGAVVLPGRIEPSLRRDVPERHDPQDLALYRMLAARGMQVRTMDGNCLAPWLGTAACARAKLLHGPRAIEQLPAHCLHEPAASGST